MRKEKHALLFESTGDLPLLIVHFEAEDRTIVIVITALEASDRFQLAPTSKYP